MAKFRIVIHTSETKRKINLGGAVFITTTCVKAVSPKIYIIDKNTNEIYFEL